MNHDMDDYDICQPNPEPENEEEKFYADQFRKFREYPLANKDASSVKRAMRVVYELESYAEYAYYELFEDIFIGQEPFSSLYACFKKDYEKEFGEPFEKLELMFLEPLQLDLIGAFVSGVLKAAREEFDETV
ncbi:hypothetical protein P8917_10010 [Bacillus atrophaeus]|uniref:hypothetical protein n=1 Tax=Bacillus atrophaeus TaxID=1452 RepID=UPI002282BB23|nr:hypothetical protein [Bacillus atrophaeus]MCY8497777.1 hypothetical protein [Bacillus atrophaeus]MCY8814918.1 hypothetical protein [Bacillus atrophaeus]MCY8821536.1 hypothetical protein [Bacillus atrophaeus]MCY8831010.1 hypothetical protein [Bacillus atrophaeus]MCY8835225.1 hypothetical protein [Bacillus atrophaeus]